MCSKLVEDSAVQSTYRVQSPTISLELSQVTLMFRITPLLFEGGLCRYLLNPYYTQVLGISRFTNVLWTQRSSAWTIIDLAKWHVGLHILRIIFCDHIVALSFNYVCKHFSSCDNCHDLLHMICEDLINTRCIQKIFYCQNKKGNHTVTHVIWLYIVWALVNVWSA